MEPAGPAVRGGQRVGRPRAGDRGDGRGGAVALEGRVVDAGSQHGLGGVAVSDGHDVVRSDGDGRYGLDVQADAEFVFVTVPATHRALEDFFVDVRSGAPGELSFVLEPRPDGAAERVRFVQVTDLHVSLDAGASLRPLHESGVPTPPGVALTGESSPGELADDLRLVVAREAPDFVAATGDLADFGKPAELAAYRAVTEALEVPVAHVPGNHDYLTRMSSERIEAFGAWWAAEGHLGPEEPREAFQTWAFGGDWRAPGSGRVPWLDEIGPAWFSFDWGPVHFVVYDSEGRKRYGDSYPQDAWLARDLALVPPGTPVVALLHFPEPASFFTERFGGVRLVASFAGHWHADRVVRHDGAVHHATSTLGFGGIEHTPRGYRVVDVDRDRVRSRFVPIDALPRRGKARDAVWSTELRGRPGIGSPAIADDVAVVAVEAWEGAGGALVALDVHDGGERWRRPVDAAVKHSAVAAPDGSVVAITVSGSLLSLDAASGEIRWQRQLGDPSVRWCYGAPAVGAGAVIAGAAAGLGAFDAATGEERWYRDDLASEDWMASWCSPVVVVDLVVAVFGNDRVHACALDLADGTTRWSCGGSELDAACSPVVLAGDVALFSTCNGWLRALDLDRGRRRWQAPLDAAWGVATPLVHSGRAFSVSVAGTLAAHALEDGARAWSVALGEAPWARRPYGRERSGHVASPVLDSEVVVAAGASGRVVFVDTATGQVERELDAGAPLASTPALVGGRVLVPRYDGTLVALAAR